jgi:hypothetical protein
VVRRSSPGHASRRLRRTRLLAETPSPRAAEKRRCSSPMSATPGTVPACSGGASDEGDRPERSSRTTARARKAPRPPAGPSARLTKSLPAGERAGRCSQVAVADGCRFRRRSVREQRWSSNRCCEKWDEPLPAPRLLSHNPSAAHPYPGSLPLGPGSLTVSRTRHHNEDTQENQAGIDPAARLNLRGSAQVTSGRARGADRRRQQRFQAGRDLAACAKFEAESRTSPARLSPSSIEAVCRYIPDGSRGRRDRERNGSARR